jgi:hypothetical protein
MDINVALFLRYGILTPKTSPVLRDFRQILTGNAKPPGIKHGRLQNLRPFG